jgi:hypothetical protein
MTMRALIAIVALLVVGNASAQDDTGRIFRAWGGGGIILSTVAEMMIATETCALGDREEWQKVVVGVDRRYRFCVAKDPLWSRLMDDFKEAQSKALAERSGRSWGSFALDALLETRGAEARAAGRDAFCSKMPWKLVLVPGAATADAKAEYLKTNPQATLDKALAFFTWIRKLGTETAWIEAPCDKDFWPEFK